ncbi:hypothetical protein J0J80_07115 [Turicibacter bilis]|uniref:hypothetical protein n=1 Tax=Turicibacter bilis TaxID=2735723 RepID=UPI001BB0ADC7|nr:hypothetical protein [Turicibacter bilis]MBS3203288.1 hypothetical protein [Turicibacter bilis]UUF09824.1 hypothetical protein J0J80_07115 [Turicibacter bilis]
MKVIINALKVYQDIYRKIKGETCEEVEEFIQLLKSYEKLSITEFSKKLEGMKDEPKERKNQDVDIKTLGKCYYQFSHSTQLMTDELKDFLEKNKNQLFIKALNCGLEEAYSIIECIELKTLKTNQLKFLGYALVDIEVRGKNKAEQKKYLLQTLWKIIESQKMNEIYESAL